MQDPFDPFVECVPPTGLEAPMAQAPLEPFAPHRAVGRAAAPAKKSTQQAMVLWLAALVFVGMAAIAVVLYQRQQPAHSRQTPVAQTTPGAPVPRGDHATRPAVPPKKPKGAAIPKPKDEPKPDPKAGQRPQEKRTPAEPKPQTPARPEEETGLEVAVAPKEKPAATEPNSKSRRGPDAEANPQETRQPGDPAEQAVLKRELAETRAALAERDLRSARQHLKAARSHAQSPADEARVHRLETLAGDVEEFWKGMGQILASLQPTEEFSIGDTMMIVVSADAKEVTFRTEGRNVTYTLHQLPHDIVVALATSRLAKTPSSKVLLGAYLAVDPEGDPAAARRLWEEATREGVDMREMMAELGASTGGPAGSKAAPPTDPAKLQQAEQAMRQQFKSEYAAATTAIKKAKLARRLSERARATADNPELRFVMLREAKDVAAAAGKPTLACLAIDQLARAFAIDDLAVKTAALEEAAKNVHGLQGHKEVVEQILKVVEQAAGANRLDEAKRLLPLAAAAAKKSNNLPLVRRVHAVSQQLGTGQ